MLRVLVSLLISIVCIFTISRSSEAQEKPFRLILGFDGLSYELMIKLYEGGYFRDFQRPLPMLATFPSISDPNWALLTNSPVEESYTKAHFSMTPQKSGSIGEEVGTVVNHLITPPKYEKAFDFKPIGVLQHLMTVTWSETSALYWIESLGRILEKPENLKRAEYSAFIMNTDIISHVSGEKALMLYMKKIEKRLQALRKNFKEIHHRDLEIILVSDHGGYYTKPKSIHFEKPLSAAGWKWKKTLKDPKDYAFVAPEIISFAAFYTLPQQECALAIAMAQIEGIHVALCPSGKNKIFVYSKIGSSQIEISESKKTVSYQLLAGQDPFEHIRFFKTHSTLSWEDYFQKSFETTYPYALVRAWEGFHKAAQNPASVLLSPQKGYVFTNLTLEILTALSGIHSTHGSFEREESLGVVMSTSKLKEEVFTPSSFSQIYFKK